MDERKLENRLREMVYANKSLDLSGITGMSIEWKPDQEQPGIGERIFTGHLEITRDLIEFGVVKD